MNRWLKRGLTGILITAAAVAWSAPQQPFSTTTTGTYATVAALQAEIALARSNEAAILTDYIGVYTRATLPSATSNSGKRALVTDLGGGPAYLRATNGCWKRISTTTSTLQNVAVATSVTIDGLNDSPVVSFTGSAFASKATINFTNACSMPQLTVNVPAGVFTVAGSLGIAINPGSSLNVAGIGTSGTWYDFAVAPDGTSVTKVRGGSL